MISVIGILGGFLIGIINPLGQQQKAWDAQRKSDLAQMQHALEQYNSDNQGYPNSTGNTGNQATQYRMIDAKGSTIDWGSSWGNYMVKVPKDPSSGKSYVYKVSADFQTYWLYASLDRGTQDSQACNGGAICTNAPATANACGTGTICSYGVSSSNTTP